MQGQPSPYGFSYGCTLCCSPCVHPQGAAMAWMQPKKHQKIPKASSEGSPGWAVPVLPAAPLPASRKGCKLIPAVGGNELGPGKLRHGAVGTALGIAFIEKNHPKPQRFWLSCSADLMANGRSARGAGICTALMLIGL